MEQAVEGDPELQEISANDVKNRTVNLAAGTAKGQPGYVDSNDRIAKNIISKFRMNEKVGVTFDAVTTGSQNYDKEVVDREAQGKMALERISEQSRYVAQDANSEQRQASSAAM